MKKLSLIVLAGITLVACNREISTAEDPANSNRIAVRSGGEIAGELHPMNETVTVSGKNMVTPQSYTYQAFAEGPGNLAYTKEDFTNGLTTGFSDSAQATAIFPVDDFLFVTWHLEHEEFGGAVSAYRYNSGTQTYDYLSIATFDDTDFHELHASKNSLTGYYEIFLVGQRSQATSGYVLQGHRGAIVGKLLFNYINNTFNVGAYKELPLPGFGANDIMSAGGSLYVVTGNGLGLPSGAFGGNEFSGVFKTDPALTNVSQAYTLTDGIVLEVDPFNSSPSAANYALIDFSQNGGMNMKTYYDLSSTNPLSSLATASSTTVNVGGAANFRDRSGAAFVPATYDINGNVTSTALVMAVGLLDGMHVVDVTTGTATELTNTNVWRGQSVAYDHSTKIIYVAAADQGMMMLAAPGYPGGVLVNDYDNVGIFAPPTSAPLSAPEFNVKDVSIYQANNIAIAVGGANVGSTKPAKGGVYFTRRN